MSITVAGDIIHVEGQADVADAEPLLAALLDEPGRKVDLGKAKVLHSAVIQILLALKPTIGGNPADPFFAAHLTSILDADEGQA